MVVVKCLICQDGFSKKDALKRHFVDTHGIPENDEVLNRYVHGTILCQRESSIQRPVNDIRFNLFAVVLFV